MDDEPRVLESLRTLLEGRGYRVRTALELLARVRSADRRAEALQADAPIVRAGGIRIDLLSCEVVVDGQAVHLTRTEYELLRVLVSNPDRVLKHRVLLSAAARPGVRRRGTAGGLRRRA